MLRQTRKGPLRKGSKSDPGLVAKIRLKLGSVTIKGTTRNVYKTFELRMESKCIPQNMGSKEPSRSV